MASELFHCEICGIQVRRVGDGIHPLPEEFVRACPEHELEWQAREAVRLSQEAEATADAAAAQSRDAKQQAVEAAKAYEAAPGGPEAPDRPGIDNTLPEEPLPGKPPEPPLGGSTAASRRSGEEAEKPDADANTRRR